MTKRYTNSRYFTLLTLLLLLRSNSNDMRKLLVQRTRNKLGDRSFSAAGHRPWNDLPPWLRPPGLPFDSFRHAL